MIHVDLRNNKTKNYSNFRDTIKYLPRKEMNTLLNAIATTEDKNRLRNKLIFNLLLSSGCRISEFLHIKTSEIDFERGLIHIKSYNTKTQRSRSVRVKKELLLDLKDYLSQNNIKNGFIFRNNETYEPLTPRLIRYILDKYTKNLDLSIKPSPHTFRHSHCIYALSEGVSINALKQQVGHMDLETTQIYCEIAGVEIIDSYKEVSF